jgi:N-acetylglucosaminyl-diphospho-decaprenol L-rhamnosyltransferase
MKPPAGPRRAPEVSLSIVSHGHGAMVAQLLQDLRALRWPRDAYEVLLTFNTPEDSRFVEGFADLPIEVAVNPSPRGFGANHNAAFQRATGRLFAVVNPDVRLPALDLAAWTAPLGQPGAGACAPLARDSDGVLQDNARRFPTLPGLAWRALTRRHRLGYDPRHGLQAIDWAAGYLLLLRREAFAQVGGFDERYFMYMEDVDLCDRLQRQGWKVLWDPSVTVLHDGQRASHRQLRHLLWHVRSALRYLLAHR